MDFKVALAKICFMIFALFLCIDCKNLKNESNITNKWKCSYKIYLLENYVNLNRKFSCPTSLKDLRNSIYILYDINPPEGFNLRRDVYIRMAVFIKQLQQKNGFENVRLVLPPWRRLYHWKSSFVHQDSLPWHLFFDIESLKRYAPILDYPEFLEEVKVFGLQEAPLVPVHKTFQLMHFKEMFENGVFRDKFEFIDDEASGECKKEQFLHGYLLQQPDLLDNDFICVRYQGSVNLLEHVFRRVLRYQSKLNVNDLEIFAILNTEIVLHESWGDREFWRARRSMRFAQHLVDIAKGYRAMHLNSNDITDRVQRPPMWEMEKHRRDAIGGPYLCGHLRRGDFIHGRESTTPTLKSAALQIKYAAQQLNLTTVFLATDASPFEFKNLKSYLHKIRVYRFSAESREQKTAIKDGGVAIIDQIICSHARYFIGTYESTFTYRIYEEREILGFTKSSTFNTFCKSENLGNCLKNSVWPIVY